MRRVVFLLVFLLATPLMAAYKIVISSHYTQENAHQAYIKLQKELEQNRYFLSNQKHDHYTILTYPQEGYFLVTIEPIQNTKVLSKLFQLLKRNYPTTFVSHTSTQHQVTSTSKQKASVQIEHNTTASEDQPVPQRKILPEATEKTLATTKYLREKKSLLPQEEDISSLMLYLIIAVSLLFIAVIALYLRLHLLKKRLSIPTEPLTVTTPAAPQTTKAHHLHVDIHSHLIPGIDDGVKTLEESMMLLKTFQNLGYKKVITTPHIMIHRYANNSHILQNGLQRLRERVQQEQLDIQIEVASEYYLDDHLMQLIADFDILTFGDNYLLFEMSYISHPVNLESMIEVMTEAGYIPVLAHPERYVYLSKNFEKYHTLKALGVLFQLNINSIAGYYSEEVKRLALELINAGMIDFIGSDAHHIRHMQSMEKVVKTQLYRDIFLKNTILNNTL